MIYVLCYNIKPFVCNFNGGQYQFMQGKYIVTFDGKEIVGVYLKDDLGLERNLITKINDAAVQQQKIAAHKPKLTDIFDLVKNFMLTARRPYPMFNIETKTMPATDNVYHPAPAQFVELLMQIIKEKQMESFVIIQSFDFRTLQYLHQHYPTIKTAMLIEDYDKRTLKEQITALGFTPTVYSPAYILVNDNLIKQCHQQNIQVIPWTVNDKKEIETLKALGVDGIISDYPNLFNE